MNRRRRDEPEPEPEDAFYFGHVIRNRADMDRAVRESHVRLVHGPDYDPEVADHRMPKCTTCDYYVATIGGQCETCYLDEAQP